MKIGDNIAIPDDVVTAEQVIMIHPCEVGDEVIIKEVKTLGYDNYFHQGSKKQKAKCISIHKWFINFHDGMKTISINKKDIALGAILIEKVRKNNE